MLFVYLNPIYYIYSSSGHLCWSPPLRSQNFMHPLILNTNFIKSESKIGYPWDSPWLETRNYNHQLGTCWVGVPLLGTCSSTNNGGGGSIKKFYIPIQIYPSKSWNNARNISLPWNYASTLKFHTHHL